MDTPLDPTPANDDRPRYIPRPGERVVNSKLQIAILRSRSCRSSHAFR